MFITFIDPLTKKEIKEEQVKQHPEKYNIVFFDYIRAMRLNDNFHNISNYLNRKYKLVDPFLNWKTHLPIFEDTTEETIISIRKIHNSIVNEYKKISEYIYFYNDLYPTTEKIYHALSCITMANYVILHGAEKSTVTAHKFNPDNPKDDSIQPEIDIILRNKISKRSFLKYINSHWNEIENMMNNLPKKDVFHLSDRDILIVELMEMTGANYKQIADDFGSGYDVDTIKMAYHRAKKKISNIFKQSNKK